MFTPGKVYNRQRDIHRPYGGQEQGGISTPSNHPSIFIFTGESGEAHGYRDEFRPDGTFWYTGEGQVGDMQMVRGNAAIANHQARGKTIHLFEEAANGQRYLGEARYLGHHFEHRPDRDGNSRQAIVFELEVRTSAQAATPPDHVVVLTELELWSRPIEELRRLAIHGATEDAAVSVRRQVVRLRSQAIRTYVLRRASGRCEACGNPAPFLRRNGQPYLEPHHVNRLADGGPDDPRFVAAVCPTCHRRAHHGVDGDQYNQTIADELSRIEQP
jgi:5-methylcytosine-specific restriction protein A